MKITDEIEFLENLPLSEQSLEFQDWYIENIGNKIDDKTIPDSLDEYDRPISFTVELDDFIVTVYWFYIYESRSNWACSKYELKINQKG